MGLWARPFPPASCAYLRSTYLARRLPHSDARTQKSVAGRIETGVVVIKHPKASYPDLPFAEITHSGYCKELSNLEEFVNKKLILVPTAAA
jgi:acyl-CoA reductase-like NAD-dependent aldehyde dehydrogenase